MDKYEYKVRAEEIKSLIEERRYPEAMAIADTIDWRKVKSISMLCDISDLYNVNRKFEVARDVLELAYNRHPEGRRIVYSLCELSIKMGDVVQAVEYYKEFVRIAPRDTGRYILQYKIYEAQEVGIEERIAVLEELKKRDYREKWAYELAFLYHRAGLATQCVEECDELILWFGEGTFVKKAMELKMLHEPLTEAQRDRYQLMTGGTSNIAAKPVEPEIRVKPVDTSIYNTLNLQKELAQNLEKVLADDLATQEEVVAVHSQNTGTVPPIRGKRPEQYAEMEMVSLDDDQQQPYTQSYAAYDQGYDTGNVQYTDNGYAQEQYTGQEQGYYTEDGQYVDNGYAPEQYAGQEQGYYAEDGQYADNGYASEQYASQEISNLGDTRIYSPQELQQVRQSVGMQQTGSGQPGQMSMFGENQAEVPSGFEELLSQEYNGQISMVVPEEENVDKQITGQLSIEDVLAEWERMKRENEQKRQAEVRKRVLEHTGNLIKEFEQEKKQDVMLEEIASEEEEFEELEEIKEELFEQDLEDIPSETTGVNSSAPKTAAHLAAGVVAGAATAAAGMAVAQIANNVAKKVQEGAKVATDTVGAGVGAAGEVAKAVVDTATDTAEAISKPIPYGANRFEEEYGEPEVIEQPQQEKKPTRIVQDYSELLYGDMSEEQTTVQPTEDMVKDAVEETFSPEDQGAEEEFSNEEFDPNSFLEGFAFEEETATEPQNEVADDNALMDSMEQSDQGEAGEEFDPNSFLDGFAFEEEAATESQDAVADGNALMDSMEQSDQGEAGEEFDPNSFLDGFTMEEETDATDTEVADTEISPEMAVDNGINNGIEATNHLEVSEEFDPNSFLGDLFTEQEDTGIVASEASMPETQVPEDSVAFEQALFPNETQETKTEEQIDDQSAPETFLVHAEGELIAAENNVAETGMKEAPVSEPVAQQPDMTQAPVMEQPMVMPQVADNPVVAHTAEDADFMARALEEQLAGVEPLGEQQPMSTEPQQAQELPAMIPPMMGGGGDPVAIPNLFEEPKGESFFERQLAMDEVARNARDFTPAEEELFGNFLRTKKAKDQLIYAIDNISMASYTGNIIITGDNQDENMELAKNLIKEVQMNDVNFSGTLAKISANSLNHKDVDSILRKVDNGAVIIYGAGALTRETVNGITNSLEKENRGIILILVDQKVNVDKLLSNNPSLRTNFNARIDIEEMTTAELQNYGKTYAYGKEYSIDEMGMLELYSRIEQLQTMGHAVTPDEVEQIIDEAIRKANKVNLKHFTDVILNKRYDAEDMIVLKAKDFI